MKNLFLTVLALLFMAGTAYPDWTIDATLLDGSVGAKKIIKIECTSDAENTSFDLFGDTLNTPLEDIVKQAIRGRYIYRIVTLPDATNPPASTYSILITDLLETATIPDRSTSQRQVAGGNSYTSSGKYLTAYAPVTIAIDSLGDGNKITLYLEFL